MKIYKYIIYTIMLFLLIMPNVYAECTEKEKKDFEKIEDQYKVKYEFNKITKKYDIYFTATKPSEYYYMIYGNNELNCSAEDDTTLKCANFESNTYDILIVGVTSTCNDVLKTINIKLPKYNELSEDSLCQGIEEFVLCSPTYEKEIDYDSFVSRVNTYKKTKAKKEENTKQEEVENNFFDDVKAYVNDNLIQIIIVVIFIILLTITIFITAKSIRKSRRLE